MADFKPSQVSGDLEVTQEPEAVLAEDTDSAVAQSTLTTIVTFTMTASDQHITRISCSGEVYGKFDLIKNTTEQLETKRTGPARNVDFNFNNFEFTTGDTLDVKVTHAYSGTHEFNATIYGF